MQNTSIPAPDPPLPAARSAAACALLSAHVLLAELALTRLLSVTLYYHYAFAVVALALAALGWGARGWKPPADETARRTSLLDACSGAATSLLLCLILLLVFPWRPFAGPTQVAAAADPGMLARWLMAGGRWLAVLQLLLLALAAALPFAFAGRALASLFAASRGRAAGLRGAEAAGGALAGCGMALLIGRLGALGVLIVSALLAALAGGLLASPAATAAPVAEPPSQADRRRAARLATGAALLGLLAVAGTVLPLPPLAALTRMRFGLREAAPALFVGALALVAEMIGYLPRRRRGTRAFLQAAGLVVLLMAQIGAPLLRIRYVKSGYLEATPLREAWTLDSRVTLQSGNVYNDGPAKANFSWGASRLGFGSIIDQLQIQIDALVASPMVRFRGKIGDLEHLRFDITSLGFHALAPGASVLVVGAGGGRDLLAGLLFDVGQITGLEVNPRVVDWVCEDYAAFTGRLCTHEGVRLVRAEARAWLARSREKYDLIQVSFPDTGAAGAAGAYALTENFLFTREALRSYLDHLNEGGILSFSHHNTGGTSPTLERLFVTALEALEQEGSQDAGAHLLLAATPDPRASVGTLIVRRRPFAPEDLRRLAEAIAQQDFLILYPRLDARNNPYSDLVPLEGRAERIASHPADIRPTEDDRPFFYLTARWWKARARGTGGSPLAYHDNAVAVLLPIGLLVVGIAAFGALPRRRRGSTAAAARERGVEGTWGARQVGFFLLCGFAFVGVEIGISQTLALVLGGPGTALTVVLTMLLVAAAGGGVAAQRGVWGGSGTGALRAAAGLSALLVAATAGLLPAGLTSSSLGMPFPLRLAAVLGLLVPLGFFLGLLGARGLRAAERLGEGRVAAAWSASALGAAAAGGVGWLVAVGIGYSAVLVLAAGACAAAAGLAGSLGADEARS